MPATVDATPETDAEGLAMLKDFVGGMSDH
jgi:hypothetical protein